MAFSDYEGRVRLQKFNGGFMVIAVEGEPRPPLPIRPKAEKDTPGGRVHSAAGQRGIPLGATPCAVCGDLLQSTYDVIAHQSQHDRSSSRPTQPYGAPSLPVYGRDVLPLRPVRPQGDAMPAPRDYIEVPDNAHALGCGCFICRELVEEEQAACDMDCVGVHNLDCASRFPAQPESED